MMLRLHASEAVTAVGHDVYSTWASIECAVLRTRATELRSIRGGQIAAARVAVPALQGIERLMAMVEPALDNLAATADRPGARVGIVVCGPLLPKLVSWLVPLAAEVATLADELSALPERVAAAVEKRGYGVRVVHGLTGGRNVAIAALDVASEILSRTGSDTVDACLLVAADSACERALLELGDLTDRLHRAGSPGGYVPSEAVGCLWLERATTQHGPRQGHGTAVLTGWSCGTAPDEALEKALMRAQAHRPTIREVFVDMNGEREAAEAWTRGATRALWAAGADPERILPVVSTGDIGAATGAVFIACAATRLREKRGTAVVWTGTPPSPWRGVPASSGALVIASEDSQNEWKSCPT